MTATAIVCLFFFFNDTATTEIYTLSLHDALPIWCGTEPWCPSPSRLPCRPPWWPSGSWKRPKPRGKPSMRLCESPSLPLRSEEHTSELQSRQYLVCRLLLEKKKNQRSSQCTTCIE